MLAGLPTPEGHRAKGARGPHSIMYVTTMWWRVCGRTQEKPRLSMCRRGVISKINEAKTAKCQTALRCRYICEHTYYVCEYMCVGGQEPANKSHGSPSSETMLLGRMFADNMSGPQGCREPARPGGERNKAQKEQTRPTLPLCDTVVDARNIYIQTCDGMLFSRAKERSSDTCYNVDKPRRHAR